MISIKSFALGVLAAGVLFGLSSRLCVGSKNTSAKKETAGLNKEIADLPDTPENRLRAAQLVVEAYPSQKFANALATGNAGFAACDPDRPGAC